MLEQGDCAAQVLKIYPGVVLDGCKENDWFLADELVDESCLSDAATSVNHGELKCPCFVQAIERRQLTTASYEHGHLLH